MIDEGIHTNALNRPSIRYTCMFTSICKKMLHKNTSYSLWLYLVEYTSNVVNAKLFAVDSSCQCVSVVEPC